MDTIQSYRVTATSTIARSGVAAVQGIEPSIFFSAPPEFRGVPGHWTPEHFFVISVASCYVSTFSGIADISHFEFISLDLEAEGILKKEEGALRFSTIVLLPVVKIAREEDRERALRLLEKAEKSCLIARSIKCPVELRPQVKVEEELLQTAKVGASAPPM
jgi:peroxiredoxin-like protein